ncbi:hypothetical protein BCR34DRAFT_281500 [Clohesyomyces aquaticus]|uniref:Rhodopsin domain-containing protein n=1 Tax=Clohesyomyces aquaticus TaxID=1231657 RepID=A0A1Y1ZRT0_9PLEO|nr:hypothetical protein BCR34DRAFT_281500 [Clohesyomyces aquaticus]
MEIVTSIVVQSLLVALALFITLLRCWVRVRMEHRVLTIPDYLVCAGWLCIVGWVACSINALYLQLSHPLAEPDLTTDSIAYLETVYISCFFFDVGLYLPKASLVTFYWWLIPVGFRRLRLALWIGSTYLACAFLATLLADLLICRPISHNWSIEFQLDSVWNSYTTLLLNWSLNFSTDLLLFIIPFFIVNCLKLRRRQKIGLIGVFSLGLITMAISLGRFIVYAADYNIDDASGNAWCTAEMCTAVVVVSLPGLKALILRATRPTILNRSNNGYIQTESGKMGKASISRPHLQGSTLDDETELVFLDRKPSPSPTATSSRSARTRGMQDAKDDVMVTTNITVTRHAF